jgi:hypothetical protein
MRRVEWLDAIIYIPFTDFEISAHLQAWKLGRKQTVLGVSKFAM